MSAKRVLVVDDSPFMRKIISDLIAQDVSFKVAGTASNGQEAIEQVRLLAPDAITLDVEMPTMNGIEALQKIREEHSTPVIMLSSLTEVGRQETISALENGAFDFVCKPSPHGGNQDIHQVGQMLHEKLHAAIQSEERRQRLNQLEAERAERQALAAQQMAAAVENEQIHNAKEELEKHRIEKRTGKPSFSPLSKKQTEPRSLPKKKSLDKAAQKANIELHRPETPSRSSPKADGVEKKRASAPSLQSKRPQQSPLESTPSGNRAEHPPHTVSTGMKATALHDLVAVGTSTGGPRALKTLLSDLPGDLEAPVVIVQHMPPNFTRSLAQRLNTYSKLEVKEAEDGDVLKKGCAYLAPGGQHMRVVKDHKGQYQIALNRDEPCSGHRPSVDRLFESLLPLKQLKLHLVLLTGMGSDGAKMMKTLYDQGVHSTFIESEETCVVYGMPRAAMELGCVTHAIPIHEMAGQVVQAIHNG